jgi:L-alanine-DL-glutamate epimerase-like enolase superfamily enzyme
LDPTPKELTRRTDIDILPGGNTITELPRFADAVASRSWDRARFDVTVCGGITRAKKYFSVAEAYGLRTEVQSWGHTLTAAANLHVMLALGGRTYGSTLFELAVPEELYEVGMIDVLTYGADGRVHAPNSADGLPGGLGVRVDWDEMDRLAFFKKVISLDASPGGISLGASPGGGEQVGGAVEGVGSIGGDRGGQIARL